MMFGIHAAADTAQEICLNLQWEELTSLLNNYFLVEKAVRLFPVEKAKKLFIGFPLQIKR